MSSRHVALLRGVNVGGKNKLPMKELAALFESAGCANVQTYIQSGNVVFEASADLAAAIPGRIRDDLRDQLGLDVPLVTRTAEQFAEIVASNPFAGRDIEPAKLYFGFLAETPDPARVEDLDPDRWPPDEYAVQGSEVYLHFANGVARSKLTTAYFDSKLATTLTVRNWNTTHRLLDMITA